MWLNIKKKIVYVIYIQHLYLTLGKNFSSYDGEKWKKSWKYPALLKISNILLASLLIITIYSTYIPRINFCHNTKNKKNTHNGLHLVFIKHLYWLHHIVNVSRLEAKFYQNNKNKNNNNQIYEIKSCVKNLSLGKMRYFL